MGFFSRGGNFREEYESAKKCEKFPDAKISMFTVIVLLWLFWCVLHPCIIPCECGGE